MARRRDAAPRGHKAVLTSHEEDYREIEAWYRDALERTALPPSWHSSPYSPTVVGPTWAADADGALHTSLPEHTLGWAWLAWAGKWLRGPDGGPWVYTMEQARAILHWQAVDPDDLEAGSPRLVWPSLFLQRLKGWGKDPVAGVLSLTAMVGPWVPRLDEHGRVLGDPHPEAWVQVAATSQDQTETTMRTLPGLITPEAQAWYGLDVGTLSAKAMGGTRYLQAVTSNYLAIEGKRPTLVIQNELQNWLASNQGHEMDLAIDGNLGKAPRSRAARRLYICNAYRQGRDSVAQRVREGWERQAGAGDAHAAGLLMDSLEAPPNAPLTREAAPEVIEIVRGDSVWLDPERVLSSVLNPAVPPSESRRKWYNQIRADEDSWVSATEWDANRSDDLPPLEPGDEVVCFFDGGKSDDATAIVACRISDGAVFVLGLWQRPPDARAHGWVAPREKVDAVVRSILDRDHDAPSAGAAVVGLWADPSHTREDETMGLYWQGLVDAWHRDYGSRLRLWAKGSSARSSRAGHSTLWDMSDGDNHRAFVRSVGQTTEDILSGEAPHDGDARLRAHVLNARRWPTRHGVSLGKSHRESRRKIDLAVAMVGARHMRREWLNGRRGKRGLSLADWA